MNDKNVTHSALKDYLKYRFLKFTAVVLETVWSCGCGLPAARWAP